MRNLRLRRIDGGKCPKKKRGSCLGTRAPKARSIVSVVFTLTRGVIHPCFPLRGRWERISKSGEQAPSPSLVSLLHSSFGTRPRRSLLHGSRQCGQIVRFVRCSY